MCNGILGGEMSRGSKGVRFSEEGVGMEDVQMCKMGGKGTSRRNVVVEEEPIK